MKKTQRQSANKRTREISSGAAIMPIAVDALIIAIAVERSLAGKHSATARAGAGKPPASPAPSNSRKRGGTGGCPASPWPPQASDHDIMIGVQPPRVPSTYVN